LLQQIHQLNTEVRCWKFRPSVISTPFFVQCSWIYIP